MEDNPLHRSLRGSDHSNESRDEGGGDAEEHAYEGALDVEHVIMVFGLHVLGPRYDEMPVVTEPDAVKDYGIEPVDYVPEGVRRECSAHEGRAAVDVPHKKTEKDAEENHRRDLFRVEDGASRAVTLIHQAEPPAALDDRRRVIEDGLYRVP